MSITSISEARSAKQQGMARAIEHAEATCIGWSDEAYAFLQTFATTNAYFSGEDVGFASKSDSNFPQPTDDRSWGAVFQRAMRAGVIEKAGTSVRLRGHASIGILWRSLVFAGGAA